MAAGTPDILACVPIDHQCGYMDSLTGFESLTSPIGIFVGFETKTPTGGDPSPIQSHVHDKIRAACGQVCVPRSVQDAVAFIESLGWCPVPPDGSGGSMDN